MGSEEPLPPNKEARPDPLRGKERERERKRERERERENKQIISAQTATL